MVKVDIYTYTPDHKHVYSGEMAAIPRVGEYIVLGEEYSAELVEKVFYNVYDGSVVIYIEADFGNDYPNIDAKA